MDCIFLLRISLVHYVSKLFIMRRISLTIGGFVCAMLLLYAQSEARFFTFNFPVKTLADTAKKDTVKYTEN